MSDEFQITVSGIEEVCAALDKMPQRLVKGAYAKALTAASVPVVEALTARTPVDTGDLAAHIKTDIAINAQGKGGRVQVGFGTKGHVARFVEFGHHMIGHEPTKKELGTVQPHPFMRPATETAADAAVEAFADSIRASVNSNLEH
jgi:HK97 gp10 family phage protein